MITYKNSDKKINTADGLRVEDGTSKQPYISKTVEADTEVDFTSADNILKFFPQTAGLQGSKETLTIDTIGSGSSVKIAGSETIAGDMTLGTFVDSMPYFVSMLMRAKKIETSSGQIPAFLFGNGSLKKEASIEAIANGLKYQVNDTEIDIQADINVPFIKMNADEIVEDKAVSNVVISDDKAVKIKDTNVLQPLLVSQDVVINNNYYFKNNIPSFNNVKVDVIKVSTCNCDNKILTKEGSENITASEMQINAGCIIIELTGDDLANVSAVDVQSNDIFTAKLIDLTSKKIVYLSYDTNTVKELDVNALVITLTGSDVKLKNQSKITFTDIQLLTFKIKDVNVEKGSSGEALLWTTKDEKSSNVVLPLNCTWYQFKECFDNLLNTQSLAPYLQDDCTIVDISNKEIIINGTSLLMFNGNAEIEKKYGKYLYIFEPKPQEAITFNTLIQNTAVNDDLVKGSQFIGCQCKNLNFNFANKALTQVTSSMTALKKIDSYINNDDIKPAKIENRSSALVQSSDEPTRVYINALRTRSIQDVTFTFEWTKDDIYNIEAEPFIKANSKYTWSFGGNAMYNNVTRDFMERFNKGENISIILQSQRTLNDKINQMFICSLKATGVISDPSIQVGDLTVALSELVGDEVENEYNILSNFMMIFSDDELLAKELN